MNTIKEYYGLPTHTIKKPPSLYNIFEEKEEEFDKEIVEITSKKRHSTTFSFIEHLETIFEEETEQ